MKKWIGWMCLLLTCVLTGCSLSKFQPSVTSLYVEKNGKLKQAIVESFEKEYYSLKEFQGMLDKEVSSFNSRYGVEKIKVDSLEEKESTLYLVMEFADADTYQDYTESYCFAGTVGEAIDAGLGFSMHFKDINYEEYSAAEVTADKKKHVVVLEEEGIVQLESKVKFVSNNVEIISEHMVQVMPIEDDQEKAYIVY